MHRLDIGPAGPFVAASWLVGVDVEEGVPIAPGGESLRLVGGRDLGLVDVQEIALRGTASQVESTESPVLNRDWMGILGLAIDGSANVIDANR